MERLAVVNASDPVKAVTLMTTALSDPQHMGRLPGKRGGCDGHHFYRTRLMLATIPVGVEGAPLIVRFSQEACARRLRH